MSPKPRTVSELDLPHGVLDLADDRVAQLLALVGSEALHRGHHSGHHQGHEQDQCDVLHGALAGGAPGEGARRRPPPPAWPSSTWPAVTSRSTPRTARSPSSPTARSTTTARSARSSRSAATASPPAPTARPSSTPTRRTARAASITSTASSPSHCGTNANGASS